jgi:hypothetical protein
MIRITCAADFLQPFQAPGCSRRMTAGHVEIVGLVAAVPLQ